jgi:hypothetical protein
MKFGDTWKQRAIKVIYMKLKPDLFEELYTLNDYGNAEEANRYAEDELYDISKGIYNSLKRNGYMKDRGYK